MSEVTVAQVADKALDKASIIVEKAASAANDIFAATAGIVTKGIEQYGPQVIDAVLWVVRIDAIQLLVVGWLWILAFLISWTVIYRGFTKGNWQRFAEGTDGFIPYMPVVVWAIVTVCVGLIFAIPRVTDVWLYTAVVKPELYLVKKTVDLVEKKLAEPAKK